MWIGRTEIKEGIPIHDLLEIAFSVPVGAALKAAALVSADKGTVPQRGVSSRLRESASAAFTTASARLSKSARARFFVEKALTGAH